MPWKNGGGVSIVMAEAHDRDPPAGYETLIWSFGRTSIDAAGPYSDLTGFGRCQVVIEGSGLVLETPAGGIDVRQPYRPVTFDGGLPIVARLENGPVVVANLMGRSAHVTTHLRMPETAVALTGGTHVVYAPRHLSLTLDGETWDLPADHALRVDIAQAPLRISIDGSALLASILPVGA